MSLKSFWRKLWNIHEHEFSETYTDVYRDKYTICYFHKCKHCGLCDVREVKTAAGLKLDRDIEELKKRKGWT